MPSLRRWQTDGKLRPHKTSAREVAELLLNAAGYRTRGTGHHHTTIAALPVVIGPEVQGMASYLDACRSKRNTVDYDRIGVATERDAEELVQAATELRAVVLAWLRENHPELLAAEER